MDCSDPASDCRRVGSSQGHLPVRTCQRDFARPVNGGTPADDIVEASVDCPVRRDDRRIGVVADAAARYPRPRVVATLARGTVAGVASRTRMSATEAPSRFLTIAVERGANHRKEFVSTFTPRCRPTRRPRRSVRGRRSVLRRVGQFYRQTFLRWIDATKRPSDERARRVAEMVDLLLQEKKQRPSLAV